MPSSVTFKGGDDAMADMRRWSDDLDEVVLKGTRDLVEGVADTTANEVPVLTGTLSGSVTLIDEGDTLGVSIGDGVIYAGWIEFGGSRGRDLMPEGRYLYPTAREAEADYLRQAEEAAEDSVGRFAWSRAT